MIPIAPSAQFLYHLAPLGAHRGQRPTAGFNPFAEPMIILLKQSKTGLYLASGGCWTTERKEARQFKSVKEAVTASMIFSGPLELYHDLGDPQLNFILPLQAPAKSSASDSPPAE